MAEHLNQPKPDHSDDPMNWIGKPIPPEAREHGHEHAKAIGVSGAEAHALIEGMANALERDQPYQAQAVALRYVDLTGYYRIMAALLSATMQVTTRREQQAADRRRAQQEAIQ